MILYNNYSTDITILFAAPPSPGIYFTLMGKVLLPGDTILITDVGAWSMSSSDPSNPGSSLVCVTSNVNTHCCRSSDGGDVGEWHFPNGNTVPRIGSDFTRSAFRHEVRLSRMNTATMPSGMYECRIPDGEDGVVVHTAVIMLEFSTLIPLIS